MGVLINSGWSDQQTEGDCGFGGLFFQRVCLMELGHRGETRRTHSNCYGDLPLFLVPGVLSVHPSAVRPSGQPGLSGTTGQDGHGGHQHTHS
jgi:hypothetical protein